MALSRALTLRICLLLVLRPPAPLLAQPDEYAESGRWVRFAKESGLPAEAVFNLEETESGTTWVETSAGLAWFDGFQWHPAKESELFSSGGPASLYGHFRDSVLVTWNKGPCAIGNSAGFRHLLPIKGIMLIRYMDESFLFVSDDSILLCERGEVRPFLTSREITVGKTLALYEKTAGGSNWGNFIDGLYRIELGAWRKKISADARPLGPVTLAENARGLGIAFIEAPADRRGIWSWNGDSPLRLDPMLPQEKVKSLDIGPDGEAMVVYESGDILVRRKGSWHPLRLDQAGIRSITFLKYRRDGSLWVGTEDGLFLFDRSRHRRTHWRFPERGEASSVNEILRSRDGSTWLATNVGLLRIAPDGTTSVSDRIGEVSIASLTGLAEDIEGNVWISSGSSFAGAFRWNGSRWDRFRVGEASEIFVHKIRRDRQGRMWFVGLGKTFSALRAPQPGAYVLTDGRFIPWGERQGLLSGRVYSFAEGTDGALWFGTMNGISRWTPDQSAAGGTWRHWTEAEGLREARVFTLVTDEHNRLWFGHAQRATPGLGTINADGLIRYYTTADGLVDDKVWDVSASRPGELWIATNRGLSSFIDGVWTSYDERSGLRVAELWPVLPLEHEVYVGTRRGGYAILDRSAPIAPIPRVMVHAPIVEGNSATVRWTALGHWGYPSPEVIATRYRLGDAAWSPWSPKREVTLVELSSGEHSLHVQARGVFGNFDEEGRLARFSIPPPLYLRPALLVPFSGLSLLALVLGALLLIRRRRHIEELELSEAKFRAATESTSSAIFIFKEDGIMFANRGARELTGLDEADLVGMKFRELVHELSCPVFDELEAKRWAGSVHPKSGEIRLNVAGGRSCWADLTIGGIYYEGSPASLATLFDISERKVAEEVIIAKQEQLRFVATELSLTEERERRRMATYLHDVIGQSLLLSKMKLREVLGRPGLDGVSAPLEMVRDMIDESIKNTRSLTFDLCPPILYELRFEAAAKSLAEHMLDDHGIEVRFEDDGAPKPLRIESRIVLFHSLKEVLHNIIKHADASVVRLAITRAEGSIVLVVEDDGRGVSEPDESLSSMKDRGFGLFNVRERLTQLGGSFEISSLTGSGALAVLRAPLEDPADDGPLDASITDTN